MRSLLIVVLFFLHSCKNAEPVKIAITPITIEPVEDTLTYDQAKHSIDGIKNNLKNKFQFATDTNSKKKILNEANQLLIDAVSETLFNYWKGTPWDFNGTTLQPKTGKIACGYFVTTLLKDAGVKLNRIRLSTVPSMSMMKELNPARKVSNQSRLSFDNFCNWVDQQKNTLFIVGLDYHTGFLVNDGKTSWFIHSNYIRKMGVVKEPIKESAALRVSATRYVTCLTNDDFLQKWLLN